MELQALLVLCGLGVAGVAVVLLMGLFSSSGTSYEEAIAQQRRAATELLALAEGKNKPKKKEKKANKKLAKKERKESTQATASEPESEAPAESGVEDEPVNKEKAHVEFSPPVVVDLPRDSVPNVKIRKRGKDPKVKPILLNKEDPSCLSDPSAVPVAVATAASNHFEEMHPKDEFELLHSTLTTEKAHDKAEEVDKKEGKAAKNAKNKPAPKAAPAAEPVREEARAPTSGEAPKEQRKAKKAEKKAPAEEVVEVIREEVVPPLNAPQPSELTTEKLLKQALAAAPAPPAAPAAPAPGKNKKKKQEPNVLSLMAGDSGGVNVGELVRLVRDAPLSRTEIQVLTDALLNKHHDPLPEHSEWTEGPNDPMQKLKKQLADKEKALADEIEASQAVHAKLKELRTLLNAERARAAAAGRGSEQAAAAARAELHTLQTRLQRLMEENHALAQDRQLLQTKLSVEGEAQAQRVQMEMHISRLSESEAALVLQLQALQAELQAHAQETGQARLEAGAAREQLLLAQQHANELAQQLQESSRALAELEQQRQCALHAEHLAQRDAEERMAVVTDLQNKLQEMAARAQAQKDQVSYLSSELSSLSSELSSMSSLSTEVSSLREQLRERDSELSEMRAMRAAPAHNGLPPHDSNKASELAKVEGVVEALRAELAAAQRGARDQRDQLARLQDQLRAYQDKNNEAIVKAQEAQYSEVAAVLRAAWPAGAPGSAAGRDWLAAFADKLRAHLAGPAPGPAPRDDQQAQTEHLQGLVDKYKKVIDDTEGVLSRLQQNVTTEEARWARQLADKQRELDELRQRTLSQMQNKIDSLESELQQAKSNHNHKVVDVERHSEERLTAGLSDKHSGDLSNGPLLQVGAEEK